MPFNRPGLDDLIADTQADVESRLGLGPLLRRGVLPALARAMAALAHGLHGHLDWLARQLFPDTADAEQLERHASLYGITRQAAARAVGLATFQANDGASMPSGTRMRRADLVEFETTADATSSSGILTAPVRAVVGGENGNTPVGTALALLSPVNGVRSPGVVDDEDLAGGVDLESDEHLRGRLLARLRQPPAGGSANDYRTWALEVPGVTRAWVYPLHMGPGTVGVTFVTDGASSSIPTDEKVAEVDAYIAARRPVTADVAVFAPIPVTFDLTIALTPDNTALRAAVEASIRDLVLREAEPGGTLPLTHIAEAISTTQGEFDHVLIEPTADVVATTGELVQLGAITWA